ncbi:ATP-binding protein [uncultured Deinococcus sp.]|uniref:ATP-binding protein n=1 Tax=uncultured Deinococcus sp. TaxID=158789 RepID=UPI0025EA54E6|nr:ATP-binding protein [uncultured Deinococcus sp.]
MSSPLLPAPSLSERLQNVTEALAAARTPHEVFDVVLAPALEALDAVAGAVLLVNAVDGRLEIAATRGDEEGAQTVWQDGPLDAAVPAGDALARREALYFEHAGDLNRAYPELEARTGGVAAVATAVLPMRLDDSPMGTLILDFKEPHIFTREEQRFLRTLSAQCAIALGRAQLSRDLEARVAARTAELEGERAALDAFVAYKEAVGGESDLLTLAQQALQVVRANLEHVSAAYYERDGELWKARVWSADIPPEIALQITAGIPVNAPNYAEATQSGQPVFVDGWDAEANSVQGAESYGAAAFLPLVVRGETRSLFSVGTRAARAWTERERALVRAVARGLTVTLERTEQARHLAEQNAALAGRTRALEGFADLTRDLTLHDEPYTLIQRAQEVVLSLLPDGYALYFEPQGDCWVKRAQTGEMGTEALQAVADAGLPYHEAGNLLTPYTTLAPYYQDQYAQDTDNIGDLVAHLGASATFPVMVNGQPRGVFAVVLFGKLRPWSGPERAVMETVMRSLGLALERAESVNLLAQRTRELEQSNTELARSNAELEQFAYVASHDLQAPIRAVTSFAGLMAQRYGSLLDARGQRYLRQIVEGGEHMKRLVDDLLSFSRLHTQQRELVPVHSQGVFDAVVERLRGEVETLGATVSGGALPVVQADAPQLDQLFQNLISNGLKYRREGVAPRVQVSAAQEDTCWRFAVRDNGIGIESHYRERIFVIFQRLHGRDEYEGTGIGLAVCKKIVERHGGRLWVESTPGQGSTFFFTLPAA